MTFIQSEAKTTCRGLCPKNLEYILLCIRDSSFYALKQNEEVDF